MLHYHGTPITPRSALMKMAGRNFCVSFARPDNLGVCLEIGGSVMGDNGAFSSFTRGHEMDVRGFYRWLRPWLRHPHWAVIPDRIGGGVEDQRAMLSTWRFPRELGAPVWHLHLPIDYLLYLAGDWPRICFGSSAECWSPKSDAWRARVDAAFNALARRGPLPAVHMLRAMHEASRGPWPFASADSTNVARNHAGSASRDPTCPEVMARRIDGRNPPAMWRDTATPFMEFL